MKSNYAVEAIQAKIKAQNGGNIIKTGDMLRYMNNARKGINRKPVINNQIKILI